MNADRTGNIKLSTYEVHGFATCIFTKVGGAKKGKLWSTIPALSQYELNL